MSISLHIDDHTKMEQICNKVTHFQSNNFGRELGIYVSISSSFKITFYKMAMNLR